MYLPPGHPIIAIQNNGNQNGRRIGKKVYYLDTGGTGKYPRPPGDDGGVKCGMSA